MDWLGHHVLAPRLTTQGLCVCAAMAVPRFSPATGLQNLGFGADSSREMTSNRPEAWRRRLVHELRGWHEAG